MKRRNFLSASAVGFSLLNFPGFAYLAGNKIRNQLSLSTEGLLLLWVLPVNLNLRETWKHFRLSNKEHQIYER